MHNILIVEANEIYSDILLETLSNRNYFKPVVCSTGYPALEAVELKHFDLIIIDADLPYLSGIKTAMSIKKRIGPNKTPFVIISQGEENELRGFISIGVAGFIKEPLKKTQIADVISKVLVEWKGEKDNIKSILDYKNSAFQK